jgi:pimeloyl-ACP methyl ester carboxylesterase
MTTWAEWRGRAVALDVDGLSVATYDLGPPDAPSYTFCHGYPSSSLDIAEVSAGLDGAMRLLTLDLPGFGASAKPAGHPYSIHGAADAVQGLWAASGTTSTVLVAHDYSVSVGQELLARRAEGALAVELRGVVWMNGGLYPDLHRATAGQRMLLDPTHGAEVAAAVDEEAFAAGIRGTWGTRRPFDEALVGEIFRSMDERGGVRLMHELLHYVADRRRHAGRWRGALEGADVPMTFVWGDLDPVSGGHVMARLRERLPRARHVPLADVGHWPTLEAPDVVADAIASR